MRAFIVRPFGTKSDIDFERVERELILPALQAVGLDGGTTAQNRAQGNIRAEMFQLLVTADLVIADLSIHNANVYYEVGIRHALRDRRTFLLSSRAEPWPFDLKTDRCLLYDAKQPAAALAELVAGLRATLGQDRTDSPVFAELPGLVVQDPVKFESAPGEFREEAERAASEGDFGHLALLGHEAHWFSWARQGLAIVGELQFGHKRVQEAIVTWEALRAFDQDDLPANQRLATLFQKSGMLLRSDHAAQRALGHPRCTDREHAETCALIGSNAKLRWRHEWEGLPEHERRAAALRSHALSEAIGSCRRGFDHDLNHSYSGLNALALITLQSELALAEPAAWARDFPSPSRAAAALEDLRDERQRLAGAVAMALHAAQRAHESRREHDPWLEASRADLAHLTSENPDQVAEAYAAVRKLLGPLEASIVREQLLIFERLAVRPGLTAAALRGLGPETVPEPPPRVLLFTGHRLDAGVRLEASGKPSPRFPASAVPKARRMIAEAVQRELASAPGEAWLGVAGAASGGDILFHEICAELCIPRDVLLAAPRELYVRKSVADAGPEWVARFDAVCAHQPVRLLGESLELPRWLSGRQGYSVWERNNLWTLFHAQRGGTERVTLISLWNGKDGDGPGGTADMVRRAVERGARHVALDAAALLAP
ncbi:MAG TPA: tetratricopeptide repeat-containing protein [Planctomycetota bacterium]|nr:tetratricopeptide repeat-containing protein [Planctomycetota bacterium]